MKRVVTAVLAAALAIAAILLLRSHWFVWVALALMEGCAVEYGALARRLHPEFPRALLLIAIPAVAGVGVIADPAVEVYPLAALAVVPLLFAVVMLGRAAAPASAVGALGWLSFGLPYLVLPVWAIYGLHRLDPRLLLVLLVAVWINDTLAFWVGSAWGRRKLAPRLSPNKSWEGSIAGLAGGALAGLAGVSWVTGEARIALVAVIAVAVVAAQLGDLVESMLKRAAGVKDSGALLPGHGGLLDRLDAIILALPVFYGLLETTGLAAELAGR
jgi:phosphatidate cytidylyltransferase